MLKKLIISAICVAGLSAPVFAGYCGGGGAALRAQQAAALRAKAAQQQVRTQVTQDGQVVRRVNEDELVPDSRGVIRVGGNPGWIILRR